MKICKWDGGNIVGDAQGFHFHWFKTIYMYRWVDEALLRGVIKGDEVQDVGTSQSVLRPYHEGQETR